MRPAHIFSSLVLAGMATANGIIDYGVSKSSLPTTPIISSINDGPQVKSTKSYVAVQENTEEGEADKSETYTIEVPDACTKESYVIHSQADLDALSDMCTDIVGSVIINNYYSPVIDTGEIQTVGGDFVVSNATNLVRIQLSKVAVISGTFRLSELTSLTAVHAPILNTVSVIDWRILPILSTINFDNGIIDIRSITISDTSLTGFSGFDVESLETLNINNNRFMESISSSLRGITETLSISANARNAVVSLPDLAFANNVTIRDVSSLSIQNIEGVNASMELINNNFQSVKLPKLKIVGGTLSLIENYNLKDAEFPSVEDVGGGLMVVNNTLLSKINFFPKLNTVGGALEFVGDFKEAAFGKLQLVRGSAYIKTLSDMFDCSRWVSGGDQNGTVTSIIRGGKIVCTSGDKQQTVQYDQDGKIVEEEISYIDDLESKRAKHVADNETSGASSATISRGILGCAVILVGLHITDF